MSASTKFIIKLTTRLEIYTNIIVVPLAMYFGIIGSGIHGNKLIAFFIGSIIAASIAAVIGTITRIVKLSKILSEMDRAEPDYYNIKLKLLSYPRTEGIIISLRWIFGITGMYFIYSGLADVTFWEFIPIPIVIILTLSVNYVISYFTTENMLSSYHNDPCIRKVKIDRDAYKLFNISKRIMMIVFSVLTIPFIILGYFFFCATFLKMEFTNIIFHILFIAALSLITLLVLVYESTSGIRAGLRVSIATLQNLERGDMDVEPVPMLGKSEIGSISQYINMLAESLKSYDNQNNRLHQELIDLTKNLSKSADSLSMSSKEQAASVEEISATSEEIAGALENVAERAVEQYKQLDDLTGKMAELSLIVSQSAEMMRSLLDMASNITRTATGGHEILFSMQDTMKTVSESSGKMTDIVGIINDISDKINLLSLNASIEAARAGDAGRGFAVVADEISKLADLTANSIKDIESLIRNNDNEIRKGMSNVKSTVESLGTIIELVKEISEKIDDIFKQIQQHQTINKVVNAETGNIKNKSDIIRISMEEHKIAIEQITNSILHLNDMTQQNAMNANTLSENTILVDRMATGLIKNKISAGSIS